MFVVDFVQDLIFYHEQTLLSILVPSSYPLKIVGLCIRRRRQEVRKYVSGTLMTPSELQCIERLPLFPLG